MVLPETLVMITFVIEHDNYDVDYDATQNDYDEDDTYDNDKDDFLFIMITTRLAEKKQTTL